MNYGTTKEEYEYNLESVIEDLTERKGLYNLINDNFKNAKYKNTDTYLEN